VAKLADALGHGLGVDAFDGLLGSGIDIQDQNRIGLVKGAAEIVEQMERAGITVRLE